MNAKKKAALLKSLEKAWKTAFEISKSEDFNSTLAAIEAAISLLSKPE